VLNIAFHYSNMNPHSEFLTVYVIVFHEKIEIIFWLRKEQTNAFMIKNSGA
jgi:hypothetical protein